MKIFLIIVYAVMFSANTAIAGNTGKISGRVTDSSSGEPLPGASVSVPGTAYGAFTDENGYYYLINIPPGNYSVKANMIGYASVTILDVKCNLDLTTKLNIKMKVSPIQTTGIVVTAERPIVDKDLTATRRAIKIQTLADMPWDSPEQAIASQSGVVVKGQEFHLRGGRSDEVSYLIDGISVRDAVEGYTGLLINSNSLSDLNLLTGIFDAEYGEVMSGVISSSIKDGGTNQINFNTNNGSVFDLASGRDYKNYQVDAGRSFLNGKFKAFTAGDLTMTGDWDPHAKLVPHQDRQDYSGLLKLTYSLPWNLRLTGLAIQSRSQFGRYGHEWYYMPANYRSDLRKGRLGVFSLNQSVSNSMFYNFSIGSFWNQAKFGVRDTFWDIGRYWWEDIRFLDYLDNQVYFDENGTAYFTAAFNPYGYDRTLFYRFGNYWKYRDRETKQNFIKYDMVAQANRMHQLKFGVDLKWYDVNNFFLYPTSLGKPIFDVYRHKPTTQGIYFQDKLEYEGLVVNAGIRYERFNPNVTQTDSALWSQGMEKYDLGSKTSYSPRIGLSYVISPTTTFHLGYGKYFQLPQFQHLYQYLSANNSMEIKGNVLGNPALRPPKTTSVEFGTVTELNDRYSLDLTIYYKDIRDLVGIEYIPSIPEPYYQYRNLDNAVAKGAEITLTKHIGQHFTGSAKYVYSTAEGTGSDPDVVLERYLATFSGDTMQTLPKETVPLDFDQRNRMVVEASLFNKEYKSGNKIQDWLFSDNTLNILFNYGSGLPVALSVIDTINLKSDNADTVKKYSTKQIDIKYIKGFKIWRLDASLNIEILNILNWENYNYSYEREVSPYEIYTSEWTPKTPTGDYFINTPYYDKEGDTNNDGVFSVEEQRELMSYYRGLFRSNPALTGIPRLFRVGFKIKF